MNSKKPVLVTTDGSPRSHRVLPHAALLASALEAPLVLVQVLDGSETDGEAAQKAAVDTLTHLHIEGDVRVEAREGRETTTSAILRVADELNAAVLALDSRGHGALRHALHGSVAADLLQNASIPVLVSGPNLELAAHEAVPYRIVATSDGSKASEALLHQLTALGVSEGCNVTLLRVHEHEPGKLDDDAAVQIHRDELEAARKLMPDSLEVDVVLREIPRGGGIDTAIIEKAREVGAQAIAMSTQGHSARRHVVIGSVALTLLGRSPLPLLLARADV